MKIVKFKCTSSQVTDGSVFKGEAGHLGADGLCVRLQVLLFVGGVVAFEGSVPVFFGHVDALVHDIARGFFRA